MQLSKSAVIVTSLLSLTSNLYADTTTTTTTTVERRTIVTPVPAPKETIATPAGSVVCFTVDASWSGNHWIPQHRVCKYENQPSGVVWVEGYWACTEYVVTTGACTKWEWKPGHWESSVTLY